jgi:hypothetical protein
MSNVIFREESETEVILTLDKMMNEAPEMASYLNKMVLPLLGELAARRSLWDIW